MTVSSNKQFFKIKPEYLVAISAIFVSLATLAVYMYQARIMQSQLHTSVWPYVQWKYNNGNSEFILYVENKGIGPALIKDTRLTIDGNEMKNNGHLFKTLMGSSNFSYANSAVEGVVISPGERIELFHIFDSAYAKKFDSLIFQERIHKFKYTICYCSVYDDCWASNGLTVVQSVCQ
jgi:hypothetical protein